MDTVTTPEFPMPRADPLDPPPAYATFRAERPVAKVSTQRGDAWLITRFDDIRAVLTDRRFSSDPRTPGYPSYLSGDVPPPPGFFMQMDAPEHARLRRMVSREFQVNAIEALRPTIQKITDDILDELAKQTPPVEFVQAVALPIASTVICHLLGVPYDDSGYFVRQTNAVLDRSRPPAETEAAAIELMGYFDRLVTRKENEASDDMFGRLVSRRLDEGKISHGELVGVAALLLLAGFDTMAQIIGLGVVALTEHPDQLRRMLDDPASVPTAVEELVRYLSVNHAGLPRAATEDVTVGGQLIRAGEGVIVLLNSGNRDDEAFSAPDEFRVDRPGRHHLGFGHGLHKCIGATLARVELQVVFPSLFRRLPGLRPAVPVEELPFRHEMVLYGLHELPVVW